MSTGEFWVLSQCEVSSNVFIFMVLRLYISTLIGEVNFVSIVLFKKTRQHNHGMEVQITETFLYPCLWLCHFNREYKFFLVK